MGLLYNSTIRVQITCEWVKISCNIVQLFILYWKKKTVQPVACAALLYPLCFSRPMGNEQKHLAKNKTAQFLNMFNDTTHQNVY